MHAPASLFRALIEAACWPRACWPRGVCAEEGPPGRCPVGLAPAPALGFAGQSCEVRPSPPGPVLFSETGMPCLCAFLPGTVTQTRARCMWTR